MTSQNFRTSLKGGLKQDTRVDFDELRAMPKGHFGVTDRKIPRGHISHEEWQTVAFALAKKIEKYGEDYIPDHLKSPFREHYLHFRINLDLWEQIPIKKAISKKDLILGCLREGPRFAEWLKKTRYYSFVNKVSEGDHSIPEEYVLEDYCGYDSLFRETELIHWTEETQDIEYAFIPVGSFRDEAGFRETFRALMEEIAPKIKLPERISALDWIKSSRGLDVSTGKTLPTRDTMRQLDTIGQGWYGKRTIIRPFPGGIRDTVIPDPDTLAKIKLCGKIFKEINEHLPESGMSAKLSQNFERVLRRKLFHHLDFKKAGLTFPRHIFVWMAEVLDEFGFDTWFIKDIADIYVDIDGDVFKTKRGFCLGWMNEALTVAIIVLLRLMKKTYNLDYDFIVFNDDLVIGDQDQDPETYSELFRFCAKEFFNSFQIFLSEKKIFSSRSVQFLEEYRKSELYGLDMEKRSIATAIYAKSLSAQYIWESKMYCNVAYETWQNDDLLAECVRRGRETKSKSEKSRPFLAGGWITPIVNGLDNSLENEKDIPYILALKEVKIPEVAEPLKAFNAKKSFEAKQKKIYNASEWFNVGDEVREFLKEQSDIDLKELYLTRLDSYLGRKKVFRNVMDERISNLSSKFWDPP